MSVATSLVTIDFSPYDDPAKPGWYEFESISGYTGTAVPTGKRGPLGATGAVMQNVGRGDTYVQVGYSPPFGATDIFEVGFYAEGGLANIVPTVVVAIVAVADYFFPDAVYYEGPPEYYGYVPGVGVVQASSPEGLAIAKQRAEAGLELGELSYNKSTTPAVAEYHSDLRTMGVADAKERLAQRLAEIMLGGGDVVNGAISPLGVVGNSLIERATQIAARQIIADGVVYPDGLIRRAADYEPQDFPITSGAYGGSTGMGNDPRDPRGDQIPDIVGPRTGGENGGRDRDNDDWGTGSTTYGGGGRVSGGGSSGSPGSTPATPATRSPGPSGPRPNGPGSEGGDHRREGPATPRDQPGSSTGGLYQPILLDLDGDGIEIYGGDGVLFIDADGNGAISNQHEYAFAEWAGGAADGRDRLRGSVAPRTHPFGFFGGTKRLEVSLASACTTGLAAGLRAAKGLSPFGA